MKLKREKKKDKRKRQDDRRKEREALGDEAPAKLVPRPIDSMREADETTVGGENGQVDEEVFFQDRRSLTTRSVRISLCLYFCKSLSQAQNI